jgi:hypothetical protein
MSRESDLATLVHDAQRAHQREQVLFAVKLKTSIWNAPGHGEVDPWSESLQAVEREGWTLAHWAVASDSGGNASAYPVFRRRPFGLAPDGARSAATAYEGPVDT